MPTLRSLLAIVLAEKSSSRVKKVRSKTRFKVATVVQLVLY